MVVTFLVFEETAAVFSRVIVLFYIPTNKVGAIVSQIKYLIEIECQHPCGISKLKECFHNFINKYE